VVRAFVFFILSCKKSRNIVETQVDLYYITGSETDKEALIYFFSILEEENEISEKRFMVTREITEPYAHLEERSTLTKLLTSQVNKNPLDIYNVHYLYLEAYAYMKEKAYKISALYFDIITKNYPDLIYKEIGEWEKAIEAYAQYIPYIGKTIIPQFLYTAFYTRQRVTFNNSSCDWTCKSPNALLTAIKSALYAENSTLMEYYQAKANFFVRLSPQDNDDSSMVSFDLSTFMDRNRIRYADTLNSALNADKAYLRTTAWDKAITTWYSYFKKIYFPSDPEIHEYWEWAGIYYGDEF